MVVPRNGRHPKTMAYSVTASAQRSWSLPRKFSPAQTSGARKAGVPEVLQSRSLSPGAKTTAEPKSVILTVPDAESSRLSGLISPWTTLWLCK